MSKKATRELFTLDVTVEGGDTYYCISTQDVSANLWAPEGFEGDERDFEGRVKTAVDALNGHDCNDLARAHKLLAIDDAARSDIDDGVYWSLCGRYESRIAGMVYDLEQALGHDSDSWSRSMSSLLDRVRKLRRAVADALAKPRELDECEGVVLDLVGETLGVHREDERRGDVMVPSTSDIAYRQSLRDAALEKRRANLREAGLETIANTETNIMVLVAAARTSTTNGTRYRGALVIEVEP